MVATPLVPTFIGSLGPVELGVIFLIAVLLFGANKIPQLARSTGEAMGEFKKGRQEVEQELEEIKEATEEEVEAAEESIKGEETSGQSGA